MSFRWTLIFLSLCSLSLCMGADNPPAQADAQQKAGEITFKAHKNHVRRASAEYLSHSRRITWYYDFATATELARETGRPLFLIFCRAGTIDDPLTGKPKCSS